MRRGAGFTLVEVLVALVIVAFGMSAVLATLGAAASNAGALREKSIAEWVALNQIAVARVALQAPSPGTTDGTVQYAGESWHWQQVVDTLDDQIGVPGIRRITVQVQHSPTDSSPKSSKDSWIATVVGFHGDAVQNSTGQMLAGWGPVATATGATTTATPATTGLGP